jgi:hypothetical protein
MKDEEEDNIVPNEDESNEELNESTSEEGFEDIIVSTRTTKIAKIPLPKLQECTKIGFWIMLPM